MDASRAAQGARSRGPRDLFAGARYLGRGIGWCARHPGLWLLGLVPAVIATALYVTALVVLGVYLDDLAAAVTPFADGWSQFWRQAVRVAAMIGIFGVGLLLAVVTFTAVTLVIGQPFYERIAERVEESAGGALAPVELSLVRQVMRAARDGLVVACFAAVVGVVLFVLGFVPVLGQTVIPVVGLIVSGYFLSGELTSVALERRGVGRKERFRLLRSARWLTVGFGGLTALVFLVPLGAVIIMPPAVAGATFLVRERLAEPGAV